MILVEDFSGFGQILADARFLAPGQVDQRLDEIADNSRFSRHRRHQLEFLELGLDLGHAFLAHAGRFGFFLEFVVIGALFTFAQLFLDGLDLLIEVILALALFHLTLDATTDTLLNLQDVDLGFQLREQTLDARTDLEHFQYVLLLLKLERKMRRNGIGQTASLFDTGN